MNNITGVDRYLHHLLQHIIEILTNVDWIVLFNLLQENKARSKKKSTLAQLKQEARKDIKNHATWLIISVKMDKKPERIFRSCDMADNIGKIASISHILREGGCQLG